MKTLKDELDETALLLLKSAREMNNVEAMVDIFKAVTAYHLGAEKNGAKKPPAEDEGTFTNILARVNGKATGGHA